MAGAPRAARPLVRARGDGEGDVLFLAVGARPHTAWPPPEIARDLQGFVLTGADVGADAGWPLERAPMALETSMPVSWPPATPATAR